MTLSVFNIKSTNRGPSLAFTVLVITLLFFSPIQVTSQAPELPDLDDDIYYGRELGAAGILESLLELNDESPVNLQSIITSIDEGFSFLLEGRSNREGQDILAWSKGPMHSTIYPGVKYGAAGIADAFLAYYKSTNDPSWLNIAEGIFRQLMDDAVQNNTLPHWSYAYLDPQEEGIPITDLKYGSAGILKLAIELYELTLSSSYLDQAMNIVEWLKSTSVEIQVSNTVFQLIPWYFIGDTVSTIRLGYNMGISGIMTQIYKLGKLVNDNDLMNWSFSMGVFLKEIQNVQGSWNTEFTDIDTIEDNPILSNFDEGVSGIMFGLNELAILAASNEFDNAIVIALEYMFSQFQIQDNYISFVMVESNEDIAEQIYLSQNRGLIGNLKTFLDLFKFLKDDQIEIIEFSINWLLSKGSFTLQDGSNQLLLLQNEYNLVQRGQNDPILVDLSRNEGTTGLLNLLVQVQKSPIMSMENFVINANLTMAISAIKSSLIFFQNEDGSWNRQRNLPNSIQTSAFTIIPSTMFSEIPDNLISSSNESSFNLSIVIPMLVVTVIINTKKR